VKGDVIMVTLGIDAHKRTHTVVAVDELGRELGQKTTTATNSDDHLEMLRWAERFGDERTWAVEDCRHLSRRLEADLLAAGERIVRVPPKLMAHARDSARTYGKSDPIDALAPRCVIRTCRPRSSTAPLVSCACWSITAKISWPSGPAA
jgi:transposase